MREPTALEKEYCWRILEDNARLQEEIALLNGIVDKQCGELVRLRAALQEIIEYYEQNETTNPHPEEIAHKALEK